MEEKFTNSFLHELITSYIDNQSRTASEKKLAEDLINSDPHWKNVYECEKLTKTLLSSRLNSVEVSAPLLQKITTTIDKLISESKITESLNDRVNTVQLENQSFYSYLIQVFSTKIQIRNLFIPRYAFAAAFIFLVLISVSLLNNNEDYQYNQYILSGSEKNIMVQAVNNFHKIVKGEIKPHFETNNNAEMSAYVNEKTNFRAFIPVIENFTLSGVICNEYKGQKLAHFLYKSDKEIIYIYETIYDDNAKKMLEVPDPVHNEILSNKYYMCDQIDDNDCTLLMWYSENVLCASVSNLPKKKMYNTISLCNINIQR